jgi:hypothetical protein
MPSPAIAETLEEQVARLGPGAAERLNSSCFCVTLDRERLYTAMERETRDVEFSARFIRPREHLFSNVPVFHSAQDLERMTAVVRMIEAAARLPAYRETALRWAPDIASSDPGPLGAFMGYDFHLGSDGPKLIEVNTNAGGAYLNALLAKAQRARCPEVEHAFRLPLVADFDREVVGMFEAEWAARNRETAARRHCRR